MPAPDRAVLEDLIERVGALTGPDSQADTSIHLTMAALAIRGGMGPEETRETFGGLYDAAPAYTASVDAALALVERALPGCSWTIEADHCWLRWMGSDDVVSAQGGFTGCGGKCTALAVVLALLNALLHQTGASDAR